MTIYTDPHALLQSTLDDNLIVQELVTPREEYIRREHLLQEQTTTLFAATASFRNREVHFRFKFKSL